MPCVCTETGVHHLPVFIWPAVRHSQRQEKCWIQKVSPCCLFKMSAWKYNCKESGSSVTCQCCMQKWRCGHVPCVVQVSRDAAGVPAGLHRPGQTAARPERPLWQSSVRVWEEMGERDLSRLACKLFCWDQWEMMVRFCELLWLFVCVYFQSDCRKRRVVLWHMQVPIWTSLLSPLGR